MLKHILILFLLLVLAAGLNGCSKKSEPTQAPQQTEVTPVQETTQEAQKEITSENLDEEVSKMEKEIDADINAEQ